MEQKEALKQSEKSNQSTRTWQGDFIWAAVFLGTILIFAVPSSREVFIKVTEAHPYMGGFGKFALLASMGDLLGMRVLKSEWIIPKNVLQKAFVWGVLGIMITLVFTVYMGGVAVAQSAGRLPFKGIVLAQAFFGSAVMNLTFGPMLYVYHMFGDKIMESLSMSKGERPSLEDMVNSVDWYTLVSFSWLKTCLLIWIPLHTAVFLLPAAYRVLASAFLSILLGVIIALSRKHSVSNTP